MWFGLTPRTFEESVELGRPVKNQVKFTMFRNFSLNKRRALQHGRDSEALKNAFKSSKGALKDIRRHFRKMLEMVLKGKVFAGASVECLNISLRAF